MKQYLGPVPSFVLSCKILSKSFLEIDRCLYLQQRRELSNIRILILNVDIKDKIGDIEQRWVADLFAGRSIINLVNRRRLLRGKGFKCLQMSGS